MEVESPMRVSFRTITINYRICYHARVIRIGASNGYGFAEEVDIAVVFTGICAGCEHDNIAII